MSKIIIISNRLPVTVEKINKTLRYRESIGGLATGLRSIHKKGKSLWIGWCGIPSDELKTNEKKIIKDKLVNNYKSLPIFLTSEDLEKYYYGFSNKTIWPLFHYFTNYAIYDHDLWDNYKRVNEYFYSIIEKAIGKNDTVWIHDYQLMLLPKLIKDNFPETKIGFFLHIPFPSYEIFRLLPWRNEILEGILGSDLVGFHTYDYVRHFTSSVRRLLRFEHNLGLINFKNRIIKVDVFPMGIDYKKYSTSHELKSVQEEANEIFEKTRGLQVILSVDRLDYTKGILERIKAYNIFLRENPQYKGKVVFILIVAPSRTKVDTYIDLRKEIEELIGHTNGEHRTIGWVPIWFFYRTFNFDSLTVLYRNADVLIVTPIRDGMNLVVKEYIATRSDKKGVVIVSETAGVASELAEAIIVNPNNIAETAKSIKIALEMPVIEQIEKNSILHNRLKRYNVDYWANDFLEKLRNVKIKQEEHYVLRLTSNIIKKMFKDYQKSTKRLFLLDYDGTLVDFCDKPEKAKPDAEVINLLKNLKKDPKNEIIIISGRDKNTLDEWFSNLNINLVAEHGVWRKQPRVSWKLAETLSDEWKEVIRPVLEVHAARTPGAFIEEKKYSLAWHYRKCDPDLAFIRLSELKEALINLTNNLNIGILQGNKVIEVKNTSINKGSAASQWLNNQDWDFIIAIGDDWTDEDMFKVLPENAYSIKVGFGTSHALYRSESVDDVRKLLKDISSLKKK